MTDDTRLGASLLIMRLSLAAFLMIWAVDKVISPAHAQGVFATF